MCSGSLVLILLCDVAGENRCAKGAVVQVLEAPPERPFEN